MVLEGNAILSVKDVKVLIEMASQLKTRINYLHDKSMIDFF